MRLGLLGLVCVCVMTAGRTSELRAADGPTQGWRTNLAQAWAEAERTGKPLVIHFHADWCGPCHEMDRAVLSRPEVARHLGTTIIGVKINADHRSDLMSLYRVRGLPTDLFIDPASRRILDRSLGSPGLSGYLAKITMAGRRVQPTGTLLAEKKPQPQPLVEIPVDAEPALQGFSPVAITAEKVWRKGSERFAGTHEGVVYHMADQQELARFHSAPAQYAPQKLGCDVVVLAEQDQAVPGDIRYGAYYEGGFYLFTSDDNRQEFLGSPKRYANVSRTVKVEDLAQSGQVRLGR
ncbi:MAG: thioredoxin family protein [Planctomycetaceae bacterium]